MVEWLCSLNTIDVIVCGGEALSWAREYYHFSVQDILENKIKKYEAEKGVTPGRTVKQTHQRLYQKGISKPIDSKNTSALSVEFELARLQASAHRKQMSNTRLGDPSL